MLKLVWCLTKYTTWKEEENGKVQEIASGGPSTIYCQHNNYVETLFRIPDKVYNVIEQGKQLTVEDIYLSIDQS